MSDWLALGNVEEFSAGAARNVAGVTVFLIDQQFHITETRCPHMGYPMSKGSIRNGIVTCAWHKWDFDLEHGGCYRGACDDLHIYPHKIENDILYVNKHKTQPDHAWQRGIREAMMQGDRFLLAKIIAKTLSQGIGHDDIAVCAYQQSFAHAVRAHQSLQAVREIHAIHICSQWCPRLDAATQVHALLHGLSIASGPTGDRPAIEMLPGNISDARFDALLPYYAQESSALGIERLLLSKGLTEKSVQLQLINIASSTIFIHQAEVFMGISQCLSLRSNLKNQNMDALFAAEISWVLGSNRPQMQADALEASTWIAQHAPQLNPPNSQQENADPLALDPQILADSLDGPGIATTFEALATWLQQGHSVTNILNSASLLCARRLARLSLNNGGLWRDAARGIRLCASIRSILHAYSASQQQFQTNCLCLLMFYLFESRWLQQRGAWDHPIDATTADWRIFHSAYEVLDLRRTRELGLAGFAADPEAAKDALLGQLIRDDLDYEFLTCLDAVLSEIDHQSEWQPYISGLITYAIDQRNGRNSLAAAQFGNSFVHQTNPET